jgi:hypothetical protein
MADATRALIHNNPTHLFVGPAVAVTNAVVAAIQQMVCLQNGCGYCTLCQGIYTRSSAHLLWIEPEQNYTRDLIEPIFETLSLQRAVDDYCFIVLTKAERLGQAPANALLKSLEEPPMGYRFMLLTAHERQLLPTIRSRAIVHTVVGVDDRSLHENTLFMHFTGLKLLSPMQFLQALDALDLSDQESIELFDVILQALQRSSIQQMDNSKKVSAVAQKTVFFTQAAALLPQSGSSKIFWKNLYLKIQSLQK